MNSCPRIRDLAPLAELPKLSYLEAHGCENIVSLAPLGKMPQLRFFYSPGNDRIPKEEVAAFKKRNPGYEVLQ